jgi:hypothetical protein
VTASDLLPIGLAAWIIQDGNYPEFARGAAAAFALEFHAASPLNRLGSGRQPGLRHAGGAAYEAIGQVLHVGEEWWAADFGVRAFQEAKPPAGIEAGGWLGGAIQLGVDPFFYFERLSQLPDAPALIFDWQIEKIEMQTAPFMRLGKRMFVRDEAQSGWKDVAATDAWADDGGHAEYLLHCRRLSGEARRAR